MMKKRALRSLALVTFITSIGLFATRGSAEGPSVIPLTVGMDGQGQQLEINQEEKDANELQPPDKVMDAADVPAGMVIDEVGAGKGRYTVFLARRVGPEGKVYANDIDEKSLAFLRDRCRKQGFANIETILGIPEDPRFPKGKLDMAFMTWVYHHLEQPVALLRNLIPSLKPGGTVVIVDPDPIKNKGGRSPENRSPDQIRREAGEAGFEVVRIETFLKLDNLYVLKVRGQDH
jgi:SAM-dependent methyltransferase